jgi:phage terminase large subunit-like protein
MSTSALSREEKLALLAALAEREKRNKQKKPLFRDRASPEQLEILASETKETFVFAGNGSGKTALGSEWVRCRLTGKNPYSGATYPQGIRAYIILDKPEKIDSIVLPELRKWMHLPAEWCHKRGKPYVSEISPDSGAWTLKFIFWDQDPMTAEGIEGDVFWFDEPPPRALYISLLRGGRTLGRRAQYLVTGTPLAAPWLRTEVYEPWSKGERQDCACFRFHTEANKQNLAEGYIEEFSARLSEKERGIRLRGEFFDLDGLALSHLFRRETHVIQASGFSWEEGAPCVVIIDPHPSKAHNAVLMGVDRDNRIYVLEEHKEKAIARKFAHSLLERGWFEHYRVMDIISDSLGSSETTSGEGFRPFIEVVTEVLRQHGIGRCRATTYEEKSDEDFIERIRDALAVPEKEDSFGQRVPKLRVLSHCVGTISDIENVQWARDKKLDENKPKLDISNRDFLACVKYGLATNLYHGKKKDRAYYVSKPMYGRSALPPTARVKIAVRRR